jgi:hypothetical protein
MKLIKICIGILIVLLLGGIGAGIYVWYTVQQINSQVGDTVRNVPDKPTATENNVVETDLKAPAQKAVETTPTPQEKEVQKDTTPAPIVIQKSDLSESNKKIVETIGVTGDTITITPAMIQCAQDAVGETRIAEIIGGSAPSPLESMKLLPCTKAQ